MKLFANINMSAKADQTTGPNYHEYLYFYHEKRTAYVKYCSESFTDKYNILYLLILYISNYFFIYSLNDMKQL